ncbi:MAG: ATP-binding protein [Chitinophagaceae bacterium]|nr:ATP-binding protein [Chitinophagaceae bacterium]
MRFLNKVIFINSATIQYAEVMVDGNVHLIGTQGVGKSTLLRAILFFYNADTLKLGISKEKKNFAEYYFPYQNSFLIYELSNENGHYCIVAFKSQGKVCFRFFDAAYQRSYFVTEDGRAFEKWEDIRANLDRQKIDYTRKIDRYEEYRDILYGNNEMGKKEFAKYGLLQSKQYQNIPRTIQNVFLNSKLEAEFIKQTMIMSLNEEDVPIDLQSYTHHLKGFETQLNDIQKYKEPHIGIQAESVVKNHLAIKHLESEKNKFSLELAYAAAQVNRGIPKLHDKKEKVEAEKSALLDKIDAAETRHRNKIDKLKAEVSVLESDLKKAKERSEYYNTIHIESIIERVNRKKDLEQESEKLNKEKHILTLQFAEVTTKYESLHKSLEQSVKSFEQLKKEEELEQKEIATAQKEEYLKQKEKRVVDIKFLNEQGIQQAKEIVEQQKTNLLQEKIRRATITHQRFLETEIENAKEEIVKYEVAIKENTNELTHLKNQIETLQKQIELEEKSIRQQTQREQERLQQQIAALQLQELAITENLSNSEHALYGWLNIHKKGWENTIGKMLSEEILFNTELAPEIVDEGQSLFGVKLATDELPVRVKTLAQYKADLKRIQSTIVKLQKEYHDLQADETKKLDAYLKKYQPLVKLAKDSLKQTSYKHDQDKNQLLKAKSSLKDLELKAKDEKQLEVSRVDASIAKATEILMQAQQNLQSLEDELTKQIKSKEREYAKHIAQIDAHLKNELETIYDSLKVQRNKFEQEKVYLDIQQQEELAGKGANTDRLYVINEHLKTITFELKFIDDNRDKVTAYKIDKNELLDKAEGFKVQKASLEKQTGLEDEKHRIAKEKIYSEIKEITTFIEEITQKLRQQEDDIKAYYNFLQSEAYLSIHSAYHEEKELYKNSKSCRTLIDDISRCYYTSIKRLDDLKESANKFLGNFSVDNIFKFNSNLTDKHSYQQFAEDLNEFISNSKIEEYEKRVNERFANVISLVGKQTNDLMSKTGEIQKVISNINKDFDNKNFVGAIRKIELRIDDSANKVVQLLIQIKQFNDEHTFDIGGLNLFSSVDNASKNKKAVELLKHLSKAISDYKKDTIALSDSFELKFRIEENQNDTGWVEKLSNVGSEGTDVLVKAMINIMLLNVFKEGASKRFKDFRLHCMMDEIGKLHPNNIKGILQFANDRNILLINGSPTETNALNYKHIYKLEKDDKRNTRIKRIISQLN